MIPKSRREMLTTLVSFVLVAFANAAVTVCPKKGSISEGLKYHSDALCDRSEYNRFKAGLGRPYKYESFKAQGGVKTVPSEKTVKCPAAGAALDLRELHQPDSGLDTVFFMENASTGPIVVSFVDEHGMEVSLKVPVCVFAHPQSLEKRQKPQDHPSHCGPGGHCGSRFLHVNLCV